MVTDLAEPKKSEAALEVLKERLTDARELVSHYEKAGIVYLAINASLVTFALKDSGDAYFIFELIGLATTVFFIFLCIGERKIRSSLESDIQRLSSTLSLPLTTELSLHRYLARFSLFFACIAFVGWIMLLVYHRNHPPSHSETNGHSSNIEVMDILGPTLVWSKGKDYEPVIL